MKNSTDIATLIGQIEKCTGILHTIQAQLADMRKNEIQKLGDSIAASILYADVFVSMYTCCETAFVRISKFFENNLDSSRLHKELLDRMTLEIPAIRPGVLTDETALVLEEFMRFRHFKRYYFEFKYDARRIAYSIAEGKKASAYHSRTYRSSISVTAGHRRDDGNTNETF